jgi:hypothetical protein
MPPSATTASPKQRIGDRFKPTAVPPTSRVLDSKPAALPTAGANPPGAPAGKTTAPAGKASA